MELEVTYNESYCEDCGTVCSQCREKIETCLKCEQESEVRGEVKFKKDSLKLNNLLKKHKATKSEWGEFVITKGNRQVVITFEMISLSPETGIKLIEYLIKNNPCKPPSKTTKSK